MIRRELRRLCTVGAMVEIRPTNDDNDLERWVAIHNVVIPDDAITAQNLRSWMDSARSYSRLLAFEDGELVAVASAVIEAGRPESIVSPLVPTESRRRGLGSALFDELTVRGQSST